MDPAHDRGISGMPRFLVPPRQDDPDRTVRTSIVWGVAWAQIGLSIFSNIGALLFLPLTSRWLFVFLGGLAIGVLSLVLVRAGRVTLAAWFLVVAFWAYAISAEWTAGGLEAPSIAVQIIFVAAAGLVLGWRVGLGATVVSVLTMLALAWAQASGRLPAPLVTHTPWSRAWTLTGYVVFAFAMVVVIVVNLRRSRDVALHELAQRREAEAFLSEVVTSAPGVFFALDDEGRLLRWNRQLEVIVGLSAAEVGRTHAADLVDPDDGDAVSPAIAEAFAAGCAEVGARFLTPDGPRDYLLTGRRVAGDQAMYVVGFGVDITERRRWEQALGAQNEELDQRVALRTAQLEEALHALESFSYSVSHDLRTPLRAINGYATILESDYAGALGGEGQQLCDRIRDNTIRMGRLIDDLMGFARLERHETVAEPVDVEELVAGVVADFSTAESGASVDWAIGPLPVVPGDEAMLRQVWANLLTNAVKFSAVRRQPRVEVSCAHRQGEPVGEYVFTVRDNGVGFDARYADRLFRVFERLHGSEFDGSGIGLAIVKRIVEAHGGRVWCEGEPGVGASFFFSVPDAEATVAR
jgi:PAS domain S-box-containing protein